MACRKDIERALDNILSNKEAQAKMFDIILDNDESVEIHRKMRMLEYTRIVINFMLNNMGYYGRPAPK